MQLDKWLFTSGRLHGLVTTVSAPATPGNRHADAASPYLRAASRQPVAWYPWGDEPFRRALAENKPVLLDIGASWCHWCHVMDRESYEDAETARLINDRFIAVKVDRDERPDIDRRYQLAVSLVNNQGGWPLTVFLTPDHRPFFAGTYYPPERRGDQPAFRDVLEEVARNYEHERESVETAAIGVTRLLRDSQLLRPEKGPIDSSIVFRAAHQILGRADPQNGGFGTRPKFPNATVLRFLTGFVAATGQRRAWEVTELALQAMARGGIMDQVGGGFHRYATDGEWRIPHFEKLLGDNALLARCYAEAGALSGDREFLEVAGRTLDFMVTELQAPDGSFAGSVDSDAGDEEGSSYTWRFEDIASAVAPEDLPVIQASLGIAEDGNCDLPSVNILWQWGTPERIAKDLQLTPDEVLERRRRGLASLRAARAKRPAPHRDETGSSGMTALAASALLTAGRLLGRADHVRSGGAALDHLLRVCVQGDRVIHGGRGAAAGGDGVFLDDHAFVLAALIDGVESWPGDEERHDRYLDAALTLAAGTLRRFWDGQLGACVDTPVGAPTVLTVDRPFLDQGVPAGNPALAHGLLRLHHRTGRAEFRSRAESILRAGLAVVEAAPLNAGAYLEGLDLLLNGPNTVVILGDRPAAQRDELIREVSSRFVPRLVLAAENRPPSAGTVPPLLEGKWPSDGRPTAYVCAGSSCSAPVTDAPALAKVLVDRCAPGTPARQ